MRRAIAILLSTIFSFNCWASDDPNYWNDSPVFTLESESVTPSVPDGELCSPSENLDVQIENVDGNSIPGTLVISFLNLKPNLWRAIWRLSDRHQNVIHSRFFVGSCNELKDIYRFTTTGDSTNNQVTWGNYPFQFPYDDVRGYMPNSNRVIFWIR